MKPTRSRRFFLKTAASGAAVSAFGDLSEFAAISAARAAETAVDPDLVRLTPDMEPIVRLIEETSSGKCVPMMVEQLRKGMPYRQFVAALFLTAIRHPSDQGHAVWSVHSAHQLSLDARIEERLLPLFWSLDNLKDVQATEERHPERILRCAVLNGPPPPPEKAIAEFRDAMEAWDQERSEHAILVIARSGQSDRAMDLLWRYAARDWRAGGHKAIGVANCCRTLETIGWRHAETALRLTITNLYHKAETEMEPQSYQPNRDRARIGTGKLPGDWSANRSDTGATLELLAEIRRGDHATACALAEKLLLAGAAQAGSIWDAVHLSAAELMLRFSATPTRLAQVPLHTNTSANALHYAFRACRSSETKYLILLQAVGWVSEFTRLSEKYLRDFKINEMPTADLPDSELAAAEDILAAISPWKGNREDQDTAVRKAFAYAEKYSDRSLLLQAARRNTFMRATNTHDLKFPAAIYEDAQLVDPKWQPHMIATSMHWQHGATSPESSAMKRAREALRTL